MSAFLERPDQSEFAPYYAGYIGMVPSGDIRDQLRVHGQETIALLSGVSDEKADQAYAAGKWTLKEVAGHVCDAERVFTYRALSIARRDPAALPGFDQNLWVPESNANARSMAGIALEFDAVRAATVQLVGSLTEDAFLRRGTASGVPVSARALIYICAGHERHHVKVIRERYLV
jgi:uncharacterized damage-inducible protein DinB